ncbi:MAG: serine/threonine-protein kinase, partial [Planctomycetota bacterium]|nr:serine/threonine-protein kinase [Planctomycetota bacterium]
MSLTEMDKALGYVAVHQRVLSQGQLQQAMSALQRNPASQGLGPLLVQHGYLTPQRLHALMSLVQRRMGAAPAPMASGNFGRPAPPPPRPTPSPAGFNPLGANQAPVFNRQIRSMQSGKFRLDDINPQGRAIPQQGTSEHQKLREQYEEYVFSQLLMKQGMVSEQQLRGVFSRKGNFQQGALSLGRQLIAEGLLNPQLVADITADLQKKIFACPQCGNCYYVEPTAQSQRFPCRRCNAQVEVPPIGGVAPNPMGSYNGGGMNGGANPMNGSMAPPRPPQPGVSGSLAGSYGSNVNGSYGGGQQANNGYGGAPGYSAAAAPQSSGFMAPVAPPVNGSTASFGGPPRPSPAPAPVFGMSPSPGGGFGAGPAAADFDPGTPMGDAAPGGDSCPESFGEYEIEREIARGGMGVVYLATKRETGEKCALKVMLESVSQNPKRLKRFQREIDAHRKLIHDNIVRILDAGKVDEFYFFTMEYVDGKPLDDRLKEELDLEIVMEILEKICRATDYAHSEGVVHRDLKPANILVTSKMVPKLTDFGLAKTADHVSVLTKTGAVVGTPYYLSPEQASGQSKDVDKRADVYALGVMMYEMITGRLPFTGKTSVELFRKIIHEDPIPPIKIKPQLTEEIQRVCLKALEKQPNDRYQSAGMLAQDIRCLIEGKPISARKPSMIKQGIRHIKKKGAAPVFMAAGIALFLIVGGGFTWHLIQSRQQAYEDEVAAEWEGYQSALASDRDTVLAALEDAGQKTQKEQGHDALDAVNRAIIYLALMEYRGGFNDKGNKILRDAGGDFAEILSFITNGRTSDAQSKLTLFGVDLENWPEALVNDENVKRALKEAESDAEKTARK